MSRILLFYLLAITITVLSCGGESTVEFEDPASTRNIDLTRHLGKEFTILRGHDTISYTVKFSRTRDYNLIQKADGDTVFFGMANKRKELILLNRKKSNGRVVIHALHVTDSTVTGLETEWVQSYYIKQLLDELHLKNTDVDTNSSITRVETTKKDIKKLFRSVIDSLEPEPFITLDQPKISTADTPPSPLTKSKHQLSIEAYPNPASGRFTVSLNMDTVKLVLFNQLNDVVNTWTVNQGDLTIECIQYPRGTYYLHASTKNERAKIKILIE